MTTYTLTQESIRDYVDSQKSRIGDGVSPNEAFEYIAAQQVLTQYDIDDDETERGHVGGGNDGGYDGIYIFVNEVLVNGEDADSLNITKHSKVDIHFIQAKYQTKFPEVCIQNWKDSFANLMSSGEPDRERYNDQVIESFGLIRGILKKTMTEKLRASIVFWGVPLVTEIHPNLLKQAEELKDGVLKIAPALSDVEVKLLRDSDLFMLFQQQPDKILTLKSSKEPLCPDPHSAIISVSLSDFNDFITKDNGELEKSLVEANIRDYQGNNAVNKAIRETLQSGDDVDFWWLNNGITVLADDVARDMDKSITLTNPRIVNGLQTSNEIWNYCKDAAFSGDDRKVLVKCIATNDQEARAKIIQATNNQSTIPPAYLRSLETIHLHIEQYFKRHGLHYDRRKSSCKNEGIAAKDIVTVPFLGQCLISVLLQQPDYARARPAQILSDDGKYGKIFNEGISPEAYFALGRLGIHVRQFLKNTNLSRAVQNDLIFYIILAACADQIGTFDIKPDDLKGLVIPEDGKLELITEKANSLYTSFGGNSKVAKSADFARAFMDNFSGD